MKEAIAGGLIFLMILAGFVLLGHGTVEYAERKAEALFAEVPR